MEIRINELYTWVDKSLKQELFKDSNLQPVESYRPIGVCKRPEGEECVIFRRDSETEEYVILKEDWFKYFKLVEPYKKQVSTLTITQLYSYPEYRQFKINNTPVPYKLKIPIEKLVIKLAITTRFKSLIIQDGVSHGDAIEIQFKNKQDLIEVWSCFESATDPDLEGGVNHSINICNYRNDPEFLHIEYLSRLGKKVIKAEITLLSIGIVQEESTTWKGY